MRCVFFVGGAVMGKVIEAFFVGPVEWSVLRMCCLIGLSAWTVLAVTIYLRRRRRIRIAFETLTDCCVIADTAPFGGHHKWIYKKHDNRKHHVIGGAFFESLGLKTAPCTQLPWYVLDAIEDGRKIENPRDYDRVVQKP